jgi:hypothetical protein
MDSEENNKIQEAMKSGYTQTDEGPYYHKSWWESYKGGVKGKLGGVVIGAILGALVGVVAAGVAALALPAGLTFAAGAAIAGGFSAGGMMYGAHEFSEVGKVTGAVAAAHEKSEERMKSFENGKFAEIKKEISELKSLITGKETPESLAAAIPAKTEADAHGNYVTKHMDDDVSSRETKPIFWNIAAIGGAIGLAAGALLAFGGVSEHLLGGLGFAGEEMSHAGVYAASMTSIGLFGASFGINRDIFRKIFDKTDLIFKGIIGDGPEPAKAASVAKAPVKQVENPEPAITTVVYEGYADYPQSDTHHRDKVLAQAKQALLSMDHTKAIPH